MTELDMCPTPKKQRHQTKAEAKVEANRRQGNSPGTPRLEVYRCSCGYWHLTNPLKANHQMWDEIRRQERRAALDREAEKVVRESGPIPDSWSEFDVQCLERYSRGEITHEELRILTGRTSRQIRHKRKKLRMQVTR